MPIISVNNAEIALIIGSLELKDKQTPPPDKYTHTRLKRLITEFRDLKEYEKHKY